jgi:uncharacterized membrane protein/protein-disulfide isomerase
MTARSRWIILVLALLGLGFATSSTWVHYKILTDVAYVVPCDFTAKLNCSEVYLSPYGSLGGVPVAIAGMLWFGVVALIAGFAQPAKTSPAGTYLFLLSTIGLAVILYLGYASFAVLKTACVLCLGTYAAVLGIFIVSSSTSSVPVSQIPGRLAGDLGGAFRHGAAGLSALILVALTAGAAVYFPKEGTRPQPPAQAPTQQVSQDFATSWAQQPRVDLGIKADGASVIVVKFNDYQCPGCRETHEWYKPVLAKFEASHPGAVKYIVKDWPWDKKCNFNTAADMHPGACAGAAAVRIAREFGAAKEQEMEAWLFANQRPPATHDAVKSAAERILGIKDFDSLYAAKLPDIRRDIADGGALSINSTPTLFINGVRVEQLMPAYFFELAIQLELNKAGK